MQTVRNIQKLLDSQDAFGVLELAVASQLFEHGLLRLVVCDSATDVDDHLDDVKGGLKLLFLLDIFEQELDNRKELLVKTAIH